MRRPEVCCRCIVTTQIKTQPLGIIMQVQVHLFEILTSRCEMRSPLRTHRCWQSPTGQPKGRSPAFAWAHS